MPTSDLISIVTDQSDYAPGSTATISTSGFGIGDDLEFTIQVIDPTTHAVLWTGPIWDVVDGSGADGDLAANGAVLTSFSVTSAYAGATIQLTATDLTTGQAANTIFTDGVTPTPGVLATVAVGTSGDGTHAVDDGPASTGPISLGSPSPPDVIFMGLETGATGTGVIQSFVQIQQHGNATTEQGYNTDYRNGAQAPLDDKNDHTFNHSILLSDVQQITKDGVTYYQFNLDINQDQHHPLISLDALQIYLAGVGNLGDYVPGDHPDQGTGYFPAGDNAFLVYNLDDPANGKDNFISIDAGPGSGHGDFAVLIPAADFQADPNFANDPHVYLYSAFGYQSGQSVVAGGFEEWWTGPPPTTTPVPSINIEKLVSPNGGVDWYFTADDNDDDLATIGARLDDAGNHIDASHLHKGTPLVLDNATDLEYMVLVTNTGNVTDTGISVTDDPSTLVFTVGSQLAAGASEISNIITGQKAGTDGTHTDTATVTADQNLSDSDSASYQAAPASINIEKLVSVDGGANWYTVQDDNDNDSTLDLISSHTGIPLANLHYGTPLATHATVQYEVVVTNTGSTFTDTGLSVTDSAGLTFSLTYTSLAAGGSEVSGPITVAAQSGGVTNTATVTGSASDDFNHSVPLSDSDKAAYNTPLPGLLGLTKGFWANHQYVWDGDTTDDWWSGIAAPKSNPYGNEGQLFLGANNPKNVISGPNDINPIKSLMLGDLNHDGLGDVTGLSWPGVTGLKFALDAADALLNNNTTGDARVILGSQALAAQLNDYNIGSEPQGLLEAAVQWLSGSTTKVAGEVNALPTSGLQPGGKGSVMASSNIDQDHNGVIALSTDYTLSKGVITFTGVALSSSNDAFQKYVDVFDDGTTHYFANGNGLANALTAFNQGQLIIDTTGQYIEWAGSNDWHANTPGMFWEVLNGHVGGIHT